MSLTSKLFELRKDLEFHVTRETGDVRITVSDPATGTYFRLSELQKLILEKFQEAPQSIGDILSFLEEEHHMELEADNVDQFMEKMRDKNFLILSELPIISQDSKPEICSHALSEIKKKHGRYISSLDKVKNSEAVSELEIILSLLKGLEPASAYWQALRSNHLSSELSIDLQNIIRESIVRFNFDTSQRKKLNRGLESFSFFNPLPIFDKFRGLIFILFSPVMFILYFVGIYFSMDFLINSPKPQWRETQEFGVIMMNYYLLITVFTYFHTLVHEFFHALVLYRLGGRPNRIGFLLFFGFIPAFFADVTDAYRLSRVKRTLVNLAGVGGQVLLGMIAILIWSQVPSKSFTAMLCRFNVFICIGAIYVNLIPVFKLDGYYILTDWVGVDNLYYRSFKFVKDCFMWIFKDLVPEKLDFKHISVFTIYIGLTIFLFGFQIILALNSSLIFFDIVRLIPKVFMYLVLVRLLSGIFTKLFFKLGTQFNLESESEKAVRLKLEREKEEDQSPWKIKPIPAALLLVVILLFCFYKVDSTKTLNTKLNMIKPGEYVFSVGENQLALLEKQQNIYIAPGNGEQKIKLSKNSLSIGEKANINQQRRYLRFTIFPNPSQVDVQFSKHGDKLLADSPELGESKGLESTLYLEQESKSYFQRWIVPLVRMTATNWWTVF